MLRNSLQGDLILVARTRLLSRRWRHLQNLRASSKIGIWEMARPSARIPPARFARRPLSRNSSSTWALSDEYSTDQASARSRLRIGMFLHLYGYNPSLATLSKRGGLPTLHSSRRKNIIISD